MIGTKAGFTADSKSVVANYSSLRERPKGFMGTIVCMLSSQIKRVGTNFIETHKQ